MIESSDFGHCFFFLIKIRYAKIKEMDEEMRVTNETVTYSRLAYR